MITGNVSDKVGGLVAAPWNLVISNCANFGNIYLKEQSELEMCIRDRLKSELPFFCPHYGMFKNNVRRQENALPESFLFQTIIDVDDKEYVEKAIEKARELNCSSGIWRCV